MNYDEENVTKTEEHLSPSLKYKLIIRTYKTGKGTWDYTEGCVL